MKKIFFLIVIVSMFSSICYATSNIVNAFINHKIKIYYENELYAFQNANKQQVYPISFDGTTYLPIRAVSSLFNVGILWNGNTNSIYLGGNEIDKESAYISENINLSNLEPIQPILNKNIKIYFNSELQTFFDANNIQVYPISYNGTTYLPIRAVSNLFNLNIEWNGETNSIYIETNELENATEDNLDTIYETKYFKDYSEQNIEDINENYQEFVEGLGLTSSIDTFVKYMYYTEYIGEIEQEFMNQIEKLEKELEQLEIKYTSYAQLYYILANDLSVEEAVDQRVFDYTVPVSSDTSFVIPRDVLYTIAHINIEACEEYEKETGEDILSEYEELTDKYQKEIVAYEIKSDIKRTKNINETLKMYDGEQKLYITSNGYVFSLPGFVLELGKTLKVYDINSATYYVGKVPKKMYDEGILDELETVSYTKILSLKNSKKFKAINYDGRSHLEVLGYSFYNVLGNTIVKSPNTIKNSEGWNTNGLYKDSSSTGKSYIIINNKDKTYNVYYLEGDKIKYTYENIQLTDTLSVSDFDGTTRVIKLLKYDVVVVTEKSKYHEYLSTFYRVKDVLVDDLKNYK